MRQEVQVKAHFSIDVDAEIETEDLHKLVRDIFQTVYIKPADDPWYLSCTKLHSASFIEEAGIYSSPTWPRISEWNNINCEIVKEEEENESI